MKKVSIKTAAAAEKAKQEFIEERKAFERRGLPVVAAEKAKQEFIEERKAFERRGLPVAGEEEAQQELVEGMKALAGKGLPTVAGEEEAQQEVAEEERKAREGTGLPAVVLEGGGERRRRWCNRCVRLTEKNSCRYGQGDICSHCLVDAEQQMLRL